MQGQERKPSLSPSSIAVADTADLTADAPGQRRSLPTASVGRIVAGRYAISRRLGQGGFGVVYEARDGLNGATVAVKLLQALPGRDEARFRDEVTALRYLRLPGIVELLDEGVDDDGTGFMVMPVLDATPFPGRRFAGTWESIQDTVVALLETLSHVHAAGMVHRDIKPSNVLVDDEMRPILLDFGACWQHDWFITRSADFGASLAGTPLYFAPEQLLGKPGDARSDLYAVALMVYECLSGRPPHEGTDLGALLRARMSPLERRLCDLNPYVPRPVCEAIARMLLPGTGQRFQSALDALGAFGAVRPDDVIERRVNELARDGQLDDDALRQLVAGPEPVFHLQSDGIAAIRAWAGNDARLAAEYTRAWVRNGLASLENEKLKLSRGSLERMQSLPPVIADPLFTGGAQAPEHLADTLAWVAVAWPTSDPQTLARVTGRSPAQLKREFAELKERHLAVELADGRWQAVKGLAAADIWEQHRQRTAHKAVADALIPGTNGRLMHEFRTTDTTRILNEVRAVAMQRIDDGRLDEARAVLSEGLRIARNRERNVEAEVRLLRELAITALYDATRTGYDHALYELGRATTRTPMVVTLERLVEAARLAESSDASRALEHIEQLGAIADNELEAWRRGARVRAANVLSIDEHTDVLRSMAADPGLSDRNGMAQVSGWWGRLYYRRGEYVKAAEAHLAAANNHSERWVRLQSRLSAGSALMEAASIEALERAQEVAADIVREAAELRLPLLEARGWWLVRGASYRMARINAPDLELVSAYEQLGNPAQAAVGLITEAALAWRAGDQALSLHLARKTHKLAHEAGFGVLRGFAACFEVLVADDRVPTREERALAFVRDVRSPPAARLQGAAMLAMSPMHSTTALAVTEFNSLQPALSQWAPGARREVLSAEECLAVLAG